MLKRTRTLIAEANAARNAKDWVAARDAFAKVLRRRPALPAIWVQYGHALKESGAIAESLDAYGRAERLDPARADTQLQIGHALNLLGRHEDALARYRKASGLDPESADARLAVWRMRIAIGPPESGPPDRVRFVNLGTTGTCNASCVHCPTGKATTAHVPRSVMPMALYRKIIDGIADLDLLVSDQIAFGLFGDGLVDPLVVERAAYLRQRLPHVRLSVNTNGASFNPARHGALAETASVIALHCESLVPETYDDLMRPLRAERVFPKFEALLQTFPGKIYVSVPVSRRNLDEVASIRKWFTERGAVQVTFDPLSSRCAEDRSVFDALALNPRRVMCLPDVTGDLIVDCDGQVLTCCQDFQRIDGIGNLNSQSLMEVLQSAERARVRKIFEERRHDELATCSRCFGDPRSDPLYQ